MSQVFSEKLKYVKQKKNLEIFRSEKKIVKMKGDLLECKQNLTVFYYFRETGIFSSFFQVAFFKLKIFEF